MTGKPKDHRALRRAAAFCTHPQLDGIDAFLLEQLAEHANFWDGANSYPGNKNLAAALRVSDATVDRRLTKLIGFGLIRRTFRADGRGKASVYSLCLENAYYPNQTQGKWLTEKPPHQDEAVCSSGNDLVNDDSGQIDSLPAINHLTDIPKPRQEPPETASPRCAATKDSPSTHQKQKHAHENRALEPFFQEQQAQIQTLPGDEQRQGNSVSEIVAEVWKFAATAGPPPNGRALLHLGVQAGLELLDSRTLVSRIQVMFAQHGREAWDVLFATRAQFIHLMSEKPKESSSNHENYELDRARLKLHLAKPNQAEPAPADIGGVDRPAQKVVGL